MKISRRLKTGCALALTALLALPCVNLMQTKAAGPVIEDQKCTLTIEAGEDLTGGDLKDGIPVKLYKTADVDVSGTFTSSGIFESMDFNVSMDGEKNADQWSALAEEAAEKLKEAENEPAAAEGTVKDGRAVIEGLEVGMYLVAPENTFNDDMTEEYVFTPYLTALPSSEYTLTGAGSDEWEYDRTISLKGEAEPQFGSLTINKTLDNYNATLGQVTCVFQIEGTDEDGKVYSNVVSITHDGAGDGSVTVDNIPAGLEVKVTEIYSGASYTLSSAGEVTALIVSDAGVEAGANPASVSFSNSYDGGNRGGYGVTNHFEVQEDGEWQWENPTAPAVQ